MRMDPRPWPAAAAAAALVALVLGCGPETDKDRIRSTLEDFATANLDGEWSEACDLMTERTKNVLTQLGEPRGAKDCETTLKTGVGALTEEQKERDFEDIAVTSIVVNGSVATAVVNGETGRLTKQGEQWLIDVRN